MDKLATSWWAFIGMLVLCCVSTYAQPFPKADFNADGRVDLQDANILSINFGFQGAQFGFAQGDVDGNHTIDSIDFGRLANDYGFLQNGVAQRPYQGIEAYTTNYPVENWYLKAVPISAAAIAKDARLASAYCYDVMLTSFGTFSAGGIDVTLTSGTFFLHAANRNTRSSNESIALDASLAYDSVVGGKSWTTDFGGFNPVTAIGAHPAAFAPPMRTATRFSIDYIAPYHNFSTSNPVARLTILNSSVPPLLPEPTSAAACGAILSFALRRRQNRF